MGDRLVVVGGGIVGASVAYHLGGRTGDPVVVYERGDLASETTAASTAMVGVSGPDPYHRMKEYGFRLYNDFFADPAADPRYRQCGRLRVATSAAGAERLAAVAGDGGRGTDAGRYANDLREFVPGDRLRDRLLVPPLADVEGALYRPRYGHVRCGDGAVGARELALEFVERARDRGVTFETGTEVTDVRTDGDRVRGVETDGSDAVDADAVVCAAGPWNRALAGRAGVDLPLGHVPSPVFALELDEPLPYTLPVVKSHESSVGLHPTGEGTVLVTYTPDGRDADRDPGAVADGVLEECRETALRWAERLLPPLADARLREEWVGVGTSTPDGEPVAGWTGVEGLSVAAAPTGVQYAPAVGRIVARQLADGDPTEYYGAVSVSRFDGHDDSRT
jgi:sarcosine oxidase subunit beta